MAQIEKRAYAEMFGPTVGDRLRLADTDLIVEVEQDYTLRAGSYGEEVKFGGGKPFVTAWRKASAPATAQWAKVHKPVARWTVC